jgi:hypothetical protein
MRARNIFLLLSVLGMRCTSTPQNDIGEVPTEPEAGVTTSTATSTFAINALLLGESVGLGDAPSYTAWKAYGYDLDGLTTTEVSTNVCTLAAGAPKINQIDGNDGVDNAWGSVILPIIQSGASLATPTTDVTGVIVAGGWTLPLQVTGLTSDPAQTATGLSAQVFVGGVTSGTPAFDQTTDWPVVPSSLQDGTTIGGGAVVRFATVYVTNGTLVARDATVPLVLPIIFANATPTHQPPAATLTLLIHDPVITFVHSQVASATNGTIAGVLDVAEALSAAEPFAHDLSTSTCGAAFTGLAEQIGQAADILSDGGNAPGVPCDAISIGLGFTATLIANPTHVGVDPVPPPDPCMPLDAGTDALGDASGDAQGE